MKILTDFAFLHNNGRDHLLSSVNPDQDIVFTSLLRILTIMPITRVQGQERHKNCPCIMYDCSKMLIKDASISLSIQTRLADSLHEQ